MSIGTARMTHHCLENSKLISGREFNDNLEVNQLINDPNTTCVVLYPSLHSKNISLQSIEELEILFPSNKNRVIFVIDGTWNSAKKMLRLSPNLANLQHISFTPEAKSEYKIRKQPSAHCLSTIEAVHRMIKILDPQVDPENLLTVFRSMVNKQIQYSRNS